MKTYLLPIFALLIVGCGNRNQANTTVENVEETTSVAQTDTMGSHAPSVAERIKKDLIQNSPFEPEGDYNVDIWDTVTGDFDGDKKIDTAYCYFVNRDPDSATADGFGGITFSNYSNIGGIMSPMIIVFLINEGDLDGNGTDELGFYSRPIMSGWGRYSVCSFYNERWCELVNISYNSNFDDCLQDNFDRNDLVAPDPNKRGYILVKELKMEDGVWKQRVTKSMKIEYHQEAFL